MRTHRSVSARLEAWLLLACALAAVGWALAAWFDWVPRLDARAQAALAWARAPAAPATGDGAVARLWLSGYAIEQPERERLLRLSAERQVAALRGRAMHRLSPLMAGEDAVQDLQLALGDVQRLRAAASAAAPVLAALPWIHAGAHARTGLGPLLLTRMGADQPLPNLTLPARAVRQAAALDVAEGRPDQGLGRVCEDVLFWRRVLAGSDTLLVSMLAAGTLRRHAALADAIAARAGAGWPGACAGAFAALQPSELDLCEPLRSEFRAQAQWTADWWASDEETVARRFLAHREHLAALDAEVLAGACGRVPGVPVDGGAGRCGPLERAFDFTGCTLAAIRQPAYKAYRQRVAELDAVLQKVRQAAQRRGSAGPGA